MKDLKPCPFCGGTKIKMYSSYSPDLHGFAHLCEINGKAMVKVESRFFETEEEAVEVWNRGVLNVPDTNVGDTISRQAAIDHLMNHLDADYLNGYSYLEELKHLPSAQPEIIRCKDCKWYGRADKRRFYRGMDCLQNRIDTIIPDKDFCSRAERREE